VVATDPKAMEEHEARVQGRGGVVARPVHAAVGADAVALLTTGRQYSTLPFRKIAATMISRSSRRRNCLHRDVIGRRDSSITDGPVRRLRTVR